VKIAGCYAPGISDHHLVYAVVNLRRQKSSPVIKKVTDFKNLNCDKLRHELSTAPWSVCEIYDDVDDVAWAWEYLYKDVMTDHLKTRKVKVRTNGLKWMNGNIRKAMNRRYALLRRAQSNPSDPEAWKLYRRQRNHVTKITREAEAEYWNDKFKNANSSSDFWRVVREMQGKSKSSVGAIKNEDGNIITNAKDKAESLNHFFSKVGKDLQMVSYWITV